MQAKFIGDPMDPEEQSRLPAAFPFMGTVFERDKFIEVPPAIAAKVAGNSHFEVRGKPEPETQEVKLEANKATGEVIAKPK